MVLWTVTLSLALAAWVVGVAIAIILERRSAAATLAWLLALVFLPGVGLLLYRLIGPLRLERKKLKRTASRRAVGEALAALAALDDGSVEHVQLAAVGSVTSATPIRVSRPTIDARRSSGQPSVPAGRRGSTR